MAWASMALAGAVMAVVDTAVVITRAGASIGPPYLGMTIVLGTWLGLGASGLWAVLARVAGALPERMTLGPAWRGLTWGIVLWVPGVVIARPWAVYDPYHMGWIMLGMAMVGGGAGAVVQHRWPRGWPPLCFGACVAIALADALAWYGHFARFHDVLAYAALVFGTAGAWATRAHWLRRRPLWALVAVVIVSHAALLGALRPLTTTAAFYGAIAPKALRFVHALSDFDEDGFSGAFGGGDCDDGNASRYPGACEIPDNGVDDNCNERVDELLPLRPSIAATPPSAAERPDLYVMVIDTTRADWGGGGSPSSLEPLRRESLVFTRAYSPYPLTERAMTAMVQGRHWRYVDANQPTLIDALLDVGYDVQIWHGTHRVRESVQALFKRDEVTASLMRLEFKGKETHSEAIIDEAIAELADRPSGPTMRWLHLDDPHYPRTAGELSQSDDERYRLEVEYAAAQVARFIDALNRSERGRKAVVVLLGDHGEEFGEHGGHRHGATLYEETLRVPLWMRLPGVEPRSVDAVVSLIDVHPTLAHHLGLAQPRGIQGVDLIEGSVPPVRVLAQIDRVTARWSSSDRPTLRAITDGRYKLIADIDRNVFLMFDLESDPGETRSIAHQEPERARELFEELTRWQDQAGCVPADR